MMVDLFTIMELLDFALQLTYLIVIFHNNKILKKKKTI